MHIIRYSFVAIVLILLFFIISCSRVIFKYDVNHYETSDLAIEAQKAHLESILKNIPKTNSPVGGSISIILPSASYIRNNFITIKDDDSSEISKNQIIEYLVSSTHNEFRAMGEAVEEREIFNIVSYSQSENPEYSSFKEDYALLIIKNTEGKSRNIESTDGLIPIQAFSFTGPLIYSPNDRFTVASRDIFGYRKSYHWYLKRKKDNPIALFEIESPNKALPPLQSILLWLEKIEKIAKGD